MDRRNNQFLEPERGPGLIGWAVKQLVMWLIGGFVVYSVVVNHQLFSGATSPVAPQSAVAPVDSAPAAEPREQLRPLGQPAPLVTNSLTLRARSDGHVLLNVEVNGAMIRFLVDTGATWVSLTHADALRAGVAGSLNYSIAMTTANGIAKAAPVTVQRLRVGQLEVDDVEAMVMQEEGGISLLGQSFLKRLQGYEMRDGVLTLTWQ